jgi:hypothetical protein
MFHILYKYLILNNQLSIPGIGVFVLEREPSKVDIVHKMLYAPMSTIKFKAQNASADRTLYDFIASEMNIDVVEAIRLFQDFSFNLKHDIQQKKWVELPEVGILTQGVRDEIKFKSAGVLKEYFPAVAADKLSFADAENNNLVTTTDPPVVYPAEEKVTIYEEEEKKPRDFWWLYALILALVAGGAIFYYYYMMPHQ